MRNPDEIMVDGKQLSEMLRLHVMWVEDQEGGCRVRLRYADLCAADLRGADLREIDLTGADLTGADLTDADLTGADLTGADLEDAYLPTTFFRRRVG